MMKPAFLIVAFLSVALFSACGYKGDLYLPRDDDKNRFGVIQTDIDFKQPDAVRRLPRPGALPDVDAQAASMAGGR